MNFVWLELPGEELNRKEIEATYAAAKKKSWKKIQAYTGFKYFTYAIRVLHQLSVNGSNPVRARIISGFFLLHLYLQRSSLHLRQY